MKVASGNYFNHVLMFRICIDLYLSQYNLVCDTNLPRPNPGDSETGPQPIKVTKVYVRRHKRGVAPDNCLKGSN